MKKSLSIAVIGHTNTGKTSLMRTLTRRHDFGEVSIHPATTRHVEMADITVPGHGHIRLFDTPGLEDSSGLYAYIEALKAKRGEDWSETLRAFTHEPSLHGAFGQEAKALAQVLDAHIVFYVIDAREAVRAKHKDELEILGRCARPVVPVLNFIASDEAREDAWRDALARVNMHAVVAFDTVVFDEAGEISLYSKVSSLAENFAPLLNALIEDLQRRRQDLRRASATLIAELLIDVAAARRLYPKDDPEARAATAKALKNAVRLREKEAVRALLNLHRFAENSYLGEDLDLREGEWAEDLFDPKVLERFGLDAGKAMAAGAAAGLAIDLMVGGLTLGAAALTGATVGFVIDTARRYGGRIKEIITGLAALRVDDPTLHLVIERETALCAALLKRGHGALDPIRQLKFSGKEAILALMPLLKTARATPAWSSLSDGTLHPPTLADRREVIDQIAKNIINAVASHTYAKS